MPEDKDLNSTDIEIIRRKTEPSLPPEKKRRTYYIKVELHEKVKAYAYWKRKSISEVVNEALEEFFKDKQVKERPKDK